MNTSGGGGTIYNLRDASQAHTGLTEMFGTLYGPARFGGTYDNGVVFGLGLSAYKRDYTYSFAGVATGINPSTRLVADKGLLYGTTAAGGTTKHATVFVLNSKANKERVLYSFQGLPDADAIRWDLTLYNGDLYGTSEVGGVNSGGGTGCGTIYEVNPSTGAEKVVYEFQGGTDAAFPSSGLLAYNGKLYGVTQAGNGGPKTAGTLYQFDPATGQ